MLAQLLLLGCSLATTAVAQTTIYAAKAWTGWDCCKPICANGGRDNSLLTTRGVIATCDRNNNKIRDLQTALYTTTGCQAGGTGFLCDSYAPVPVNETYSFGFAIQVTGNNNVGDNPNCCKCYDINWTSGPAADRGRRMIVQIVTPGGTGGDIKVGDLIILTPGGGLGPFDTGCARQYGNSFDWGERNGGVHEAKGCEGLPPNLQGGCYWRFNWGGGDMLGWDIQYRQVECPERLTSLSGCNNRPRQT